MTGAVASVVSVLAFVSASCGDVSAVECGDGTFCPAGTECESGRCLASEGSCSAFPVNTPCRIGADERGFCGESACTAGVSITGQVTDIGGEDVIGATVGALDREWMDADVIEIGTFDILAVAFDTDLVLRFSVADRLDMITRRLTLTDSVFVINEDANQPLRMIRPARHQLFVQEIGEMQDVANGLVAVHLLNRSKNSLGGATASLVGDFPAQPLYFTGGVMPDAAAVTTTAGNDGSSLIVFPNVVPGTYEVRISHPAATSCRAAGDTSPEVIRVDVLANTMTNVGEVICGMP